MQLRNIAIALLLLPAVAHSDFTAQHDNVSIKATVCTENITLDMYTNVKLRIEPVAFLVTGLVPVWVEITNTTDSAKQISNQSSKVTQKNKKLFVDYCKSHPIISSPIIRSLIPALMVAAMGNGFVFYDFRNEYKKSLSLQPWDELTIMSKLKSIRGTIYATQAAALTTFSALIGLSCWWLITDLNKRKDAALEKLTLQEYLVIEPGETVKKLVILGAEKQFTLNVVDPHTNQAIQQFEYEYGVTA